MIKFCRVVCQPMGVWEQQQQSTVQLFLVRAKSTRDLKKILTVYRLNVKRFKKSNLTGLHSALIQTYEQLNKNTRQWSTRGDAHCHLMYTSYEIVAKNLLPGILQLIWFFALCRISDSRGSGVGRKCIKRSEGLLPALDGIIQNRNGRKKILPLSLRSPYFKYSRLLVCSLVC